MSRTYYDYEEDYYDDEYYQGGFQKIKKKNNKNKSKGKGHQNKYGQTKEDFFDNSFWNDIEIIEIKEIQSEPKVEQKPAIIQGEHCQQVQGYTIDFDRLADIQTIEQEHNGYVTYGIKFLFAGKKGLYRIAWFNRNERLRNAIYEEKIRYWKSLPKKERI